MAILRRTSFAFPRQWNPAVVPTWPVEIDPAWEAGLVGCFVPGSFPINLAQGAGQFGGSTIGSYAVASGPSGPAITVSGSPSTSVTLKAPASAGSSFSAFSFASLSASAAGSGGTYQPGFDSDDASNRRFQFRISGNQPEFIGFSGGGVTTNIFGSTLTTQQQIQGWTQSARYSSADGIPWISTNGIQASGAPQAQDSLSNSVLTFGWSFAGGTPANDIWPGAIYAGYFWTRKLTNIEDAKLAANPFAPLRPIVRRQYYAAAVASGTTGTLTETGANGTLAATGSVKVSGTLAVTGSSGSLSSSAQVSISGTLNETGTNGTLTAAAKVSVSGLLAETSANGTLAATGSPAVSGTLNETGINGTLSSVGVAAITGALNAFGISGTLSAHATVSVSGVLIETGANGTLAASGTVTLSIPFDFSAHVITLTAPVRTISLTAPLRTITLKPEVRLIGN